MSFLTSFSSWIVDSSLGAPLIDQIAKATLLLLAAWGISLLLRRGSAAVRHQIWTAALLAVLALPLLSLVLPAWQVPIFSVERTGAGNVGQAVGFQSESPETTPGQKPLSVPREIEGRAIDGARPLVGKPTAVGATSLWKFLPLVWAVGALLLLARVLFSALAAWKVVRDSAPVTETDLVAEVDTLRRQLGIRSPVHLVENSRITMPMAWGVLRAAVLLPASARSWDEERRRVVLLHELAHLKRWDCQTLLLARVVTALHWFNPLAWVAVRRLQAEREHACDDLVLTAGTPGADYAQHLLDIARAMQSSLSPGWAMVAMARPTELEGRLLAILDPHLQRGQATRFARAAGLFSIFLLVLPLASLQPRVSAEETPLEEEKASAKNADLARNARLIEAFTLALGDEDSSVRTQAAHALGSLEDASAVSLLEEAVRDDASADVREQAAWALGMIEDPAALSALRAAVGDPSGGVREQAAWALGMIENDAAVPELRTALADDDAGVREQAAWALGMIESDAAVDLLSSALADDDAGVRQQAAWALGMIESSSAVGPLTSALKTDASPGVREQAAWALGMIGDEAALDALLDAVSEEDTEVRKQALWAVGQISS